MAEERHPSPTEQVKRLYEDSEQRTAQAFEQLVARDSFGELLARLTENVVGVIKIGNDAFDLVLRNLRLAGRQDITRLGRQLARTEDKLELVLQEVERLNEQIAAQPRGRSSSSNGGGSSRSARSRSGSRSRSGGNGSS
jgi:uncharacterized membrane protein YgcG